jgi:hypothetical protein
MWAKNNVSVVIDITKLVRGTTPHNIKDPASTSRSCCFFGPTDFLYFLKIERRPYTTLIPACMPKISMPGPVTGLAPSIP